MRRSLADENYLKAVYHLSSTDGEPVTTGSLATYLQVSSASVTDKMKRLQEKGWLNYKKSRGVRLSTDGEKIALTVIRKHRLWELFLVETLGFEWDEVHDVAEQLEHIQSDQLIEKIDEHLGYPKTDPHGDLIPDKDGKVESRDLDFLSEVPIHQTYQIVAVSSRDTDLLKYLNKKDLRPGIRFDLLHREDYDRSIQVKCGENRFMLSGIVAKKIKVEKI